jgi:indole-3-glycerol phosphate synthase/phosphoribosylanthranilate isomerase
MSGSILGEILAAKRRRIAAGEFTADTGARARSLAGSGVPSLFAAPDGVRFTAALSSLSEQNSFLSSSSSKQNLPLPLFLAEIKHRSPSAGVILPDASSRIESVASAYRRGGASAVSVVVEQDFFGGHPAWLPRAKAASGLPVLMKDFIVDEVQLDFAAALGADAVLLIAAALDGAALEGLLVAARSRSLAVLVEAHDEVEVERALAAGAEIVGVNARDLKTFEIDLPRMARLGALLPASVMRVAESGIRSLGDVEALAAAGFGAFLVGEALLSAPDPAAMLRTLRGQNPTEIKICGITREEDVDACLHARVDWIGLVFAEGSPRRVTPEEGRFLRMRAKGEAEALREGCCADGIGGTDGAAGSVKGVVAVFAGNNDEEIRRVIELVRPDVIQMSFPGLSLSKKSFSSDITLWNTIRIGRDDLSRVEKAEGDALHFDTSLTGVGGGTGKTFDWKLLDGVDRSRPVVLAGGLKPENVADAVRSVRPDVVDVASGVESAPGIKDAAKIAAFVREVRGA